MLGHRKLEVPDYLAILKRRRWLLAALTLIGTVAGYVTVRFIPPRYQSQTLVLIEQPRVGSDYVTPVVTSNIDSRLSSMKEQILSRSRIEPIITRYNLYANQQASMDDRIDMARKAIDIKPIHSTIANSGGLPGFFIFFTYSDAHTAQLVCSEITSLFTNENISENEKTVEGTTDFIKGQLEDAKRALDEQDAKLAAFQRQYVGKLPGEEGPNLQIMTSLNGQMEAANQAIASLEQDKIYDESLLAQQTQPSPLTPGSSASTAPYQDPQYAAKQADIQKLKNIETQLLSQYTPDYPDVIAVRRQIAELERSLQKPAAPATPGASPTPSVRESVTVQQLRAKIRAADIGIQAKRREQDQLQTAIRQYQEKIASSPAVEEEYKALTRDNESAQKFYQTLLSKAQQAKLSQDLVKRQEGEQFHVMDLANLPESPSFPKPILFIGGGFAIGLILALAISAFLEYKDTALRTERDVWAFTRLPTLAIISVAGDIPADHPTGGFFSRWRRNAEIKPEKETLSEAHG